MKIEWQEPFEPGSVTCAIVLDRILTTEEEVQLERAVLTWYDTGVRDGFGGGFLHFMSDAVFVHDNEKPVLEWWMDAGSARISHTVEKLADSLKPFPFVRSLVVGG